MKTHLAAVILGVTVLSAFTYCIVNFIDIFMIGFIVLLGIFIAWLCGLMLIEIWMTSSGPYYWNEFLRKVSYEEKKKKNNNSTN